MSDPLVPNYKRNVGRLSTDRYDFEDHIRGKHFRHEAEQLDLVPAVTIAGETKNNVQDAIAKLAEITSLPSIPDATSTTKGLIKLTGDLSGSADNVIVSGIRGYPVTTLPPSAGQVLTWTGSAWSPSNAANVFSAGGDLSGSNISQQVVKVSGDGSGIVDILANSLKFNSTTNNPSITHNGTSSGNGDPFSIYAQSTTSSSSTGGLVKISGGLGGASGLRGGVSLGIGNLGSTLLDIKELTGNRRVLGLVSDTAITNTEMPANTGDMVVYIKNAATTPTTGNPGNGAILYAHNGKLYTKYADGTEFELGSVPNPSIWGDEGKQTYTYRAYNQTTTNSRVTAFTYTIPNNYFVKFDIMFVGKLASSTVNAAYSVNLCMGYTVDNSGATYSVGSLTPYDFRTRNGNDDDITWINPVVSNTGSTVTILTGAVSNDSVSPDRVVDWVTVIQMVLVRGV